MLEVDAVEAGEDMIDKSGAPLFAVGEEIETDLFLVMYAQRRGVVLCLFQRVAFETKYHAGAVRLREPTGPGKTADGGGSDGWKLHGIFSNEDFSFVYICCGAERQNGATQ